MLRLSSLSVAVCLLLPVSASAQLSYEELQKLARDAVRNEEVGIEPAEFRVEDGSFYYTLGGARTVLDPHFEHFNPVNQAIEAQLQVEVLRQTRSTTRKREFWEPILKKVEAVIADKLPGLQDAKLSERERNDLSAQLNKQVEEVYSQAMAEYAKKQGLKLGLQARYRPPHTVTLVTSPPGGRIFLTHAIQMRIAQGKKMDPDWRLIEDASSIELEGKYFYLLQWGSKTVRSDQPIQIDRSGKFVLR